MICPDCGGDYLLSLEGGKPRCIHPFCKANPYRKQNIETAKEIGR